MNSPLPHVARASLTALILTIAACKSTPDLAREHLRRGDVALTEGRYSQALSAYSHAREIAPEDETVQRAMMTARAHLIAENAAQLTPEAVEDARYEATLLLENDRPRAHVYLTALANILARKGDIEGAKAKLGEALTSTPDSALAHAALGALLMTNKGDAAQARSHLEAASKSRPADLRTRVRLAQLDLTENNVAGAIDLLEAALRIDDDFEARMTYGNTLLRQQKPAEAAAQFQRAAALDPKSGPAFSSLGQALLTAGNVEEAERALRVAVQLTPDPSTAVPYGFALARMKRPQAALAVFEKVLSEDPQHPAALYGAGNANEDLGRSERAAELYRRLLALPPGGPDPKMLADLQRSATPRLAALTPLAASASPMSSPTAPSAAPDVLGTRR